MPAYRCNLCGGPLLAGLATIAARDLVADPKAPGIWRHGAVLPRTGNVVSLGEGSTPLVPLRGAAGSSGLRVHGKLESLNPTLSFKDRAMALAASAARDLGLEGLMLASTGNAAVSAAAYAAAAGLGCRIVCGTGSDAQVKLRAANAHGAEVRLVEGDYSTAYADAVRGEAEGWFNVTTTYRNPLLAEAYRGVAIEVHEQLGRLPDAVVVPVGAGPLLYGLLQGFTDILDAGQGDRLPRLIGVQAQACAPLAHAWSRADWRDALAEPITVTPTSATAIADSLRGYEREGLLTLAAVRKSGGAVVAIAEEHILEATLDLGRQGILVEPAAGAAVAALNASETIELMPEDALVVVMLTGHGAKTLSVTSTSAAPPARGVR
ncbi:pyridoxal-phosphate dependent enzyme [Amycolatopsis palatopharyngis]|uniref:pyridoxal-phosphate dependent enzyme n=1 Tax=Amycolatopsis palatopharyngis TaxID=187982 RepID=UPI0013BE9767|nr:pyridoxal-phosphate dependent enzyme [Amycolatopsis palatopharyngis]